MWRFASCLLLVSCAPSRSPAQSAPDLVIRDVVVSFTPGKDLAICELTLVDGNGAPITSIDPPIQFSYDLRPPNDEEHELCLGDTYVSTRDFDSKTNRFKFELRLRSTRSTDHVRECRVALLEDGWKGPVHVHARFKGESYDKDLPKLDLPDEGRDPALEVAIDKLTKSIEKMDPNAEVLACTPSLTGDQRLEAVDRETLLGEASRTFASTEVFSEIAQYRSRRPFRPDLKELIAKTSRVLVFVPKTTIWPSAGTTGYTGGVFDGRATVLDLASGKAICSVAIHTESSKEIQYKVTTARKGDDVRTVANSFQSSLDADFVLQFKKAVFAAMSAAGAAQASPRLP